MEETDPTPYSHHSRRTGGRKWILVNNLSWTPQVSAIKSGYSFKEKGSNVMSTLLKASWGKWANVALWDENLKCEYQIC